MGSKLSFMLSSLEDNLTLWPFHPPDFFPQSSKTCISLQSLYISGFYCTNCLVGSIDPITWINKVHLQWFSLSSLDTSVLGHDAVVTESIKTCRIYFKAVSVLENIMVVSVLFHCARLLDSHGSLSWSLKTLTGDIQSRALYSVLCTVVPQFYKPLF